MTSYFQSTHQLSLSSWPNLSGMDSSNINRSINWAVVCVGSKRHNDFMSKVSRVGAWDWIYVWAHRLSFRFWACMLANFSCPLTPGGFHACAENSAVQYSCYEKTSLLISGTVRTCSGNAKVGVTLQFASCLHPLINTVPLQVPHEQGAATRGIGSLLVQGELLRVPTKN